MATIDDIEDIGLSNLNNDGSVRNQIIARVTKKYKTIDNGLDLANDSFIPGTKTIYMKTWGCTHNTSDSEYMAGILAQNGYHIINDPKCADLWILNSCTVKSPSEQHFRNEVSKALECGKYVVVAGCVPQSQPNTDYLNKLSIVGVQQIDRIVEVVEETLKGNYVRLLAIKKDGNRKAGGSSLHMPKIRKNPLIEIIAINTGCLNECTYCKTKHARGKLGSYTISDIVERAKDSFQEGVKEIWLTSEDTGAYGRDIGTNLPQLLHALIRVIPDDCMLRIGMTNPPYIFEHLEAMAEILNHPRIYSFLHIPVQSGSDFVLQDMKREYCIEDFSQIVNFLRTKVNGITIATDIICGFPTETEKDFDETLKLVDKYKFPVLFINQFYPRPGTPAAKMKKVPTIEVKRRSRALSELFASYMPYQHRVDRTELILVTEESHDKLHFVGHNKFYEQILLPKHENYLGKMIKVKIISSGKHYMMGVPIDHHKNAFYSIYQSITQKSKYLYNSSLFYTCCIVLFSSLMIKLSFWLL